MKLNNHILEIASNDPWDKSILYELPHFKYCRSFLQPKFLSIYCSRNDNLAECMDRLESHENTHARHVVIGKDGRFIQYSPLNQAIRHIRGKSPINNSNTISIELCCNGRLIKTSNEVYVAQNGNRHYTKAVKNVNGRNYDKCSYAQLQTLSNIIKALYYEYGFLELIDGGIFRNSGEYKISPILNLEKEMKNEF